MKRRVKRKPIYGLEDLTDLDLEDIIAIINRYRETVTHTVVFDERLDRLHDIFVDEGYRRQTMRWWRDPAYQFFAMLILLGVVIGALTAWSITYWT
jgi:hypothetical protein